MSPADWQNTPFTLPLLLIGLLCGWSAYIGWRRRAFPGAVPFTVLMAALAGWSLVNLVEKSLVNQDLRQAVSLFVYVFIVTVPGAWLVFAARFARQGRWLSRRAVALLFIEPALILGVAFTNPWHGLLRTATAMRTNGPWAVMVITQGPFFYVNAAYTHLLFAAGAVLLITGVAQRPGGTVGRVALVLGAMLVPLLGNIAYAYHLQPAGLTDLTPLYFAVPGLAAAWLLFRVRVFDILPIARDFVLDCLGDAVFVLDTRCRLLDANPAARSLLPPPPAVRQQSLAEAIPELGRCLRMREQDGEVATEIRLGRAGAERSWDVHVLPLADPQMTDGVLVGVLVRLADVTERKRAEEARAQLAALVESSEDAIIGEIPEGVITSWNPGAERLYGYSAQEVIGRPVSLLVPPDRSEESRAITERVRRGERVNPRETVRRRKDGTAVAVAVTVSPIRDGQGQVVGASTIARDITPQQKLREALRQRAKELAEANRQKDQFLAMLAHELRNPLAPLANGLHVLRLPGTTPQVREQTGDMMARQVRHLTHLVDDLLDVSRISRGKVQLRKQRLDLGQLARTTAEDRRPVWEGAGLALRLEVPETPVWVLGDATRLAQILSNLLDNAAKFSERGGTVTVRVTADGEHCQAVLSVCDQGIGIEPGVLARLFTPFVQADRTLDRSRGGLGLGLALVKGLAGLHGGEVQAASTGLGQGAEFTVRLPLEQEPAALVAPPLHPPPSGKPFRILVVEDNKDAADCLRLLLRMLGHDVRVAYTGPAGVAAGREWRPDVVLCDIGLPGLDGYGVARELRRNPSTARTRLLALTGYGQDEDKRRSREAGFDFHLVKPADPEELRRLLAGL